MTPSMPFGGADAPHCSYDMARYVVVSAPLEHTTSYMQGTADGPLALIAASAQVELFDEECGDAHLARIHSLPPLDCTDSGAALITIRETISRVIADGKIPLLLGGEHTVTVPSVQAVVAAHGPCTVVIFDAHADLRDSYEGTPFSHACATRRLHEIPGMTPQNIVQIGIRSLSRAEHDYATCVGAHLLPPCSPTMDLLESLPIGARTYISIDLDGIDPSEAPSVGTPEPGGLTYRQQLDWLAALASRTTIVGMDIVEICPRPGTEHGVFLAARLAFKSLAYHYNGGRRSGPLAHPWS